MTLTHILDTSAWIALLQRESGGEMVASILGAPANQVAISALTLVELYARLRSFGREGEFVDIVEAYRPLFAGIMPMDEHVAARANALRQDTPKRIPSVDAMIAATAATHNAVLVHRDPHYSAISEGQLQQLVLALPE